MSDPAQFSDGLAALQAKRTQGRQRGDPKRRIPPSQNPTTLPPYKAPEVVVDLGEEESRTTEAPAPAASQPAAEPAAPSQGGGAKPTSRKVGLYLDEAHEDFLEQVRVAGNALRPRVNLSGSAVVRLAIDRLMADMTAEQVRDALVAKPIDPSAVGRRRR